MSEQKIGKYALGDILRGHNAELKPLGVETKDYNFVIRDIMSQGVEYTESYDMLRLSKPVTPVCIKTEEVDVISNFEKVGHINLIPPQEIPEL